MTDENKESTQVGSFFYAQSCTKSYAQVVRSCNWLYNDKLLILFLLRVEKCPYLCIVNERKRDLTVLFDMLIQNNDLKTE